MRKFLLLIILLACIFLAWDVYLAPHALPYETTLTSKDGTKLDARITQASSNSVTFISLQDSREYNIPTSRLDLLSRYKVLRLANKEQPQEPDDIDTSPNRQQSNGTTANYLSNLQRQIDENNRKITALEAEKSQTRLDHFGSSQNMSAKERSLQRQIERLIEENNRHQYRIIEINTRGH